MRCSRAASARSSWDKSRDSRSPRTRSPNRFANGRRITLDNDAGSQTIVPQTMRNIRPSKVIVAALGDKVGMAGFPSHIKAISDRYSGVQAFRQPKYWLWMGIGVCCGGGAFWFLLQQGLSSTMAFWVSFILTALMLAPAVLAPAKFFAPRADKLDRLKDPLRRGFVTASAQRITAPLHFQLDGDRLLTFSADGLVFANVARDLWIEIPIEAVREVRISTRLAATVMVSSSHVETSGELTGHLDNSAREPFRTRINGQQRSSTTGAAQSVSAGVYSTTVDIYTSDPAHPVFPIEFGQAELAAKQLAGALAIRPSPASTVTA